ncbi:MAG TPA: hypothetical protein DCY31_09065 [Ruminococcaceae bacterium]|nr:hypothetical protein [Oscillospiraceae bacterium]
MQEVILKKVMFGGYDCYEVMNHINALQIKLNRTKKDSDKLNSLKAEAEKLRSEIAEKDREIEKLSREISDYENNLKMNQPAKDFLRETEEYTDKYVDAARSLERSVKNMTAEQLTEAKKKISEIQAYLENVSNMIGETFISVSDLRNEYKSINKSYKEMISETAVTEKKEKKTAPKKSAKKSPSKKTAKKKSDSDEALELIRQTEEKYNSI